VQRVETTSKIVLSENDNNQTLINDRGVTNHPGNTLPLLLSPIPSLKVRLTITTLQQQPAALDTILNRGQSTASDG